MANSKVQLADGTVLMDLTGDSVTAAHLEVGYTAHGADGEPILGTLNPGGITPSGNIELTQQSGTDVTNYATASVRRGSAILDTFPEFDRVNHSVTITPIDAMGTAGWIDVIADGIPITITPSDLGAVVPSGNKELTQQSGTDVTNYATASVRSAAVTVSAAKSVSNHTATVTPSVAVGTSGWIGNGASGTPVTVSPADLGAVVPSGNKPITSTAQVDVSGYATAQVSDANLVAANIASGKTILGIAGTHTGGKPEQTKTATANGTVYPDSGYVLSSVTVAIPYYEGW